MPVNIGVIGVGYLGQHHARIYSEMKEAQLVAVADVNVHKAEEIATTYGCKAFSDYRDIFEKCDAVSIVTPTSTHHTIAMDCLRAGKDVLIEKPITVSVQEAQMVIEEAGKMNLILQVGHLERYNPGIIAASEMIAEPKFIESERLSPFMGRGTDVDVTLDLMIHDIDIVMSIVQSKLKDIRAIGESVITDRIDVAKTWLEFENGCKALITASRLAPAKLRMLKVFQKDAYIAIDYQNQEVRRYVKSEAGIVSEIIKPENKEPLKEELKDFVSCVKHRKRPKVSGIEGMNALEVAIRITEMLKGTHAG
ncbi:MAG: Gfo/Idh/MocA family oxidoreductase [Nitrospirae bacterium]|nr:Gfo/Idh/MocA family oxidoreductase [Nitrospirota bacterium]